MSRIARLHTNASTNDVRSDDSDADPASEVERAKTSLEHLTLEALKKDPGLALQRDAIVAFATLRASAPDEWARQRAMLKQAGVSLRDLNLHLKSARTKLRVVPLGATAAPTVRSMLGPDAPGGDLLVPGGYSLTPAETTGLEYKDDEPRQAAIAFAPVVITRRFRDNETGTESLEVAWLRDGEWHRLAEDRGVIMNPKKLLDLASYGFPVAGDNAAALSRYLHSFEAENHANLPCSLTSSHLGWQGGDGKDGFLWGRTLIGPEGEDAENVQFHAASTGDDQLADGYHTAGSFDAWRDGISAISSYPYALAVFYAAFVAVLLCILRAPSFVLDICRKTTVGKTTLLRIAASVWGVPDESQRDAAIHTWDTTQVWAERAIGVVSNLPMILDDTKRAAGRPQIIEDVVYMVVSGQARARGSVDGMARTQTWNTVLLSSGEAPATSYSQAGGTRTRCLELRGYPLGDQSETAGALARNLNSAVCANYGHAGPKFVRYLLSNRGSWPNWRQQYQEEIDRYRKLAPGCPEADRLAQAFAAMAVAACHIHAALNLPWKYEDGVAKLDQIWLDVIAEARDAAGPERALRDVMSWAYSNELRFSGRVTGVVGCPAGWAGIWAEGTEWTYIAFYPTVVKKLLTEFGYEPEAILYEWKSKGWLDVRKDRKTSYTNQAGELDDKKPQLVVILRKGIEDAEKES